MNNAYNGEWMRQQMQFRLQSARRKNRKRLQDFDKQLLKLERERCSLLQQQRNLGWMELDPPVMRGWKRYFVLRDDVARSKHASFFQVILNRINTVQLSDTKSFTAKKRKWGRKIQVERNQKLAEPDSLQLKRMNFTERELQFFSEVIIRDTVKGKVSKRYRFVEPWRFVLRIRPNLITRTRVRDEVIEQRLAEINMFFKQRHLQARLEHLLFGKERYKWKMGEKEKYPFKNKQVNQLLDELACENTVTGF